jgi:MFS family permease
LGCLVVMTVGMFMATTVNGVIDLCVWRVFTGLGIGGMVASVTAVTAEFSNDRRRHLSISLMSIGYPVGAAIGGGIIAPLLRDYSWRTVFYFGGTVTALFIPLFYFLVPESVYWLTRKQPQGALEKINRTFARLGYEAVEALPQVAVEVRKRSIEDIFAKGLIATTLIVTTAYFFHITTFYFILKWVPKIVVDMGFAPSSAAGVLMWASIGGASGGACFGLLTLRIKLKPLVIFMFFVSTAAVTLFGRSPADLGTLSAICAVAGFFTNAGVVGMFAIFAQAYPTHVRAFGTGFAIGTGRGGSVLAPIIAGFLFSAGCQLSTVAFIMGMGSLCAGVILLFLKLQSSEASQQTDVSSELIADQKKSVSVL